MVILSINSVINPFLDNDIVTVILGAPFGYFTDYLTNLSSAIYRRFIAHFLSSLSDAIEMEEIEVRESGDISGAEETVRIAA